MEQLDLQCRLCIYDRFIKTGEYVKFGWVKEDNLQEIAATPVNKPTLIWKLAEYSLFRNRPYPVCYLVSGSKEMTELESLRNLMKVLQWSTGGFVAKYCEDNRINLCCLSQRRICQFRWGSWWRRRPPYFSTPVNYAADDSSSSLD